MLKAITYMTLESAAKYHIELIFYLKHLRFKLLSTL